MYEWIKDPFWRGFWRGWLKACVVGYPLAAAILIWCYWDWIREMPWPIAINILVALTAIVIGILSIIRNNKNRRNLEMFRRFLDKLNSDQYGDNARMDTITCPNCQARIAVEQPKLFLLNHPDKCVVVVDPVRVKCPNPLCGKEYISAIQAVHMQLVWPPAPPRLEEKRIVVPNLVMPKDIKGRS